MNLPAASYGVSKPQNLSADGYSPSFAASSGEFNPKRLTDKLPGIALIAITAYTASNEIILEVCDGSTYD